MVQGWDGCIPVVARWFLAVPACALPRPDSGRGRNVRFDWKRFWCPRGESIVLTAGGGLLDPHVRKTTAVGVDVPLQLSFQDIEPAARFAQLDGQRVLEEPAQKVSHGC